MGMFCLISYLGFPLFSILWDILWLLNGVEAPYYPRDEKVQQMAVCWAIAPVTVGMMLFGSPFLIIGVIFRGLSICLYRTYDKVLSYVEKKC